MKLYALLAAAIAFCASAVKMIVVVDSDPYPGGTAVGIADLVSTLGILACLVLLCTRPKQQP